MFNVIETHFLFFVKSAFIIFVQLFSSISGGLCRREVGTFLSESELVPSNEFIKRIIIDIFTYGCREKYIKLY